MATEKEKKNKASELDAILSEINNGIKKGNQSRDNAKAEIVEQSKELRQKLSQTADLSEEEEESESFVKNAKIVEDAPEEKPAHPSVKHIEVTFGEEIEPPKQPSPKKESPKVSKAEMKKTAGTAVARTEGKKEPKYSKRQKSMAVLGVVISFFVIVGVVATVWNMIGFTSEIVNATALKEELANAIFPLVIIDTPEFETPTSLDNSAIISSAIWEFIVDEADKSKYRKDDLGSIYVPDVDIEYYVRRLFGSEVKIQHQSVEDASVQMAYSPENKYYIIESTPKFLPYTPRVDKIEKNGDLLTLRVSYILPDVMWNTNAKNKNQTADKIMEYKVKKVDKSYQVLSVKLLEIATVSQMYSESDLMDQLPVPGEEPVPGEDPVESIPAENAPAGDPPASDTPVDDNQAAAADGAVSQ